MDQFLVGFIEIFVCWRMLLILILFLRLGASIYLVQRLHWLYTTWLLRVHNVFVRVAEVAVINRIVGVVFLFLLLVNRCRLP